MSHPGCRGPQSRQLIVGPRSDRAAQALRLLESYVAGGGAPGCEPVLALRAFLPPRRGEGQDGRRGPQAEAGGSHICAVMRPGFAAWHVTLSTSLGLSVLLC